MKTDSVIVNKSPIHKKGVFATRDFKKGEIVLHWDTSKTITKNEYDKLSLQDKNYIPELNGKYIIIQTPEKYVNHSCDANTYSKDFCDIAKKDIKQGEEITTDYSFDPPAKPIICNCKNKNCKKIIK